MCRADHPLNHLLPSPLRGVTAYIPEDIHTSYLIILVTYINTPLSLVLFMSLCSLYMLTSLVFVCIIVCFSLFL